LVKIFALPNHAGVAKKVLCQEKYSCAKEKKFLRQKKNSRYQEKKSWHQETFTG